jgi:alkylated DNA repair dioxygenase AlkB
MEVCVYADADERRQVFEFLDGVPVEYHKEYKRFNKIVKVPRGQASFTLNESIHYDYKVSGGSPPNRVMCDTLKAITARVNEALGTHFNTILMNKYLDGDDCIGYHRDRETGWAEGTGFATVSFGAERDFHIKDEASGEVRTILHKDGWAIHLPSPMNQTHLHAVPKRKRVKGCRISLTFREIVPAK